MKISGFIIIISEAALSCSICPANRLVCMLIGLSLYGFGAFGGFVAIVPNWMHFVCDTVDIIP